VATDGASARAGSPPETEVDGAADAQAEAAPICANARFKLPAYKKNEEEGKQEMKTRVTKE
jgi:hypothetical protein